MSIVFNSCAVEGLEGLVNKVETTVDKEPSYYHLVKADALRIRNYFWDSIEEYLTAIELDSSNLEAFKGLGIAYKQVGLAKSAVNAFNSGKKLNPFDKYLYFEAGCCYCMEQNFSKAAIEFKKALKICPDYPEAIYNLALSYEMNHQYGPAINEYNRILANSPEFIRAYNNLGSLYMKINDYAEAIRVFRSLLKLNPEFVRAYLGMAISFDKLGDKAKAMRYYKKYLKQRPNSDNVPYIIERVGELQKARPVSPGRARLKLVS